ncbi:MAG: lipid-A-disaccharide synthase [Saprospiraceae bacterium]
MNNRYYIIAGEVSGDIHGAELVKSMKKLNSGLKFKGFGGDNMKEEGVDISVGLDRLSIMGFIEVLLNIGTILSNFRIAKKEILEFNPEALILIDFPGFNLRIAKWAKKHNIKVYYFIAPMVWAWGRGRVKSIKKNLDKLYVILPFEKDFFSNYGIDAVYVGNPLVRKVNNFEPDPYFLSKLGINSDSEIIAFFPGSRNSEIKRNIKPVIPLIEKYKEKIFLVAAMKNTDDKYLNEVNNYENVHVLYDRNYDILNIANAGIIKSGTSSLEASLFKLPHVVVFMSSGISAVITRLLIKVKYISLINLILDKLVVKELLQSEFNFKNLDSEISNLFDEKYRTEKIQEFEKGIDILKMNDVPTDIIAKSILFNE